MMCPILSSQFQLANLKTVDTFWVGCQEDECKWWIRMYTTEGSPTYGCAINLNAMKNSDGRIVV